MRGGAYLGASIPISIAPFKELKPDDCLQELESGLNINRTI